MKTNPKSLYVSPRFKLNFMMGEKKEHYKRSECVKYAPAMSTMLILLPLKV